MSRFKRSNRRASIALAAFAALFLLPVASASAAPPLKLTTQIPDHGVAGGPFNLLAAVLNQSGSAIGGKVAFRFDFPAGIVPPSSQGPTEVHTSNRAFVCELNGAVEECTTEIGGNFPPGREVALEIRPSLSPGASGALPIGVEVETVETGATVQAEQSLEVGPLGPFAIRAFRASALDTAGAPAVQAGGHPVSLENVIEFANEGRETFDSPEFVEDAPPGNPRNIVVHLPPGFVGSPGSMPRCTAAELTTVAFVTSPDPNLTDPNCPLGSQVGLIQLNGYALVGLFNMVPPPGFPAAFGFTFQSTVTTLYARVRPGDHGIDIVTPDAIASLPLPRIEADFWGVPSDPSHDPLRGTCLESNLNLGSFGKSCPSGEAPRAFFRAPTSCTGEALHWGLEVDTYQEPGVYAKSETTTPAVEGCEKVPFDPSITVQPTTHRADSPTGLNVDLTMPQEALESVTGKPEADVKDTTVVQPVGTRVNPATADGLTGCSLAQIGYEGNEFPMPNPVHFSGDQPACPDSSKIGTVEIESPLIPDKLEGFIYQAKQGENPFGSTLAFYAVASADGVMIKLPALVETDPSTGQVTTIFRDSPELPFKHYKLHFFGGSRAPLITPPTCGTKNTESTLTGWANPAEPVHYADSFQIDEGAQGGPCPADEAARPFAPSFEAGTTYPAAGEFSDFVLKVGRADGMQELSTIETTLPEGLLAKLAGVPYCPEASIEAARHAHGAAEQAAPSCPAASEVGIADAGAGAGPTPFHQVGRVYLAGPYKGAPLSLAVVTPALAGPLDLGTVVVRVALRVNPETAQITAVSDPIPSVLDEGGDGFPLDLRQVTVQINRPEFTLNPTSCEAMSVDGKIGALQGASAAVGNRFQARGCGRLGFGPKLKLQLKGKTSRRAHPALRAVLTMPKSGQANIARAQVTLPHAEFLDQGHIQNVCTQVQFKGEGCPASSILGHATAYSPLLDHPLSGPVYLMSGFGHKLPDLAADLNGQIRVLLHGKIDTGPGGGIRNTFEVVPDAPVTKFVLSLKGGSKGLIQNSENVCAHPQHATALFVAHNGKFHATKPKIATDCRGKAPKHRHRRHH